jgi:hypothetical protein
MELDRLSQLSIKGYEAVVAAVHAARPKTYVHDICLRCGKTVKRT